MNDSIGVEHPRRDGPPQRVVDEGEEEVLPDVVQRPPAQLARPRNLSQIPLHQPRFDAMLARQVELRGAHVLRGSRWVRAERVAEGFQLALTDEVRVSARFVMDATGRSASFARAQGARPRALDRLFGFTRYVPAAAGSDPRTLIESFAEGWWYTALLPGGLRVVACMTDVDLGRELGLLDLEPWTRLLDESRWVRQVVGDTAIPETCLARPASSHMLRPVHGEGWLAVGDAASAFDPLSAQGIVKALRSGVVASYAAADFLLKQEGVGAGATAGWSTG
jgi:flavin-dependent dehydrogenase